MSDIESSKKKSIYDNAKNHFLGNFPKQLPIEQAYVHIGMYLGWVIEQDLYSPYFEDEADTQIFRFKNRQISCTILSEIWDGYLGYELFSEQGNLFTYYYYGGGVYRKDYQTLLAPDLPSIYHVTDDWDSYDIMAQQITKRFEEWKKLIG
ncbi:DUF7832 domain-containing protein [Catalinimonas niigatensis]|uniref:DUF7832 domain-containing protein n=1 Tax=Catalinimonas niigatensis TaxID=1397264 RepID=UPI0026655E8B|nr:hypothetical protein [Catalinimonas niigatensis]WPP51285.1 hypothetical protein PZB72_02630 [Catalinimonas niigatensis]